MAVLTIPKKTFEKEIGKVNDVMDHKLAMFGTPLDNVDEENNIVNIEIFPNRPDLLSYQNFKACFLTYLGKRKPSQYKLQKSGFKIIVDKSVSQIRPYSMAAIVKNCKFDDERIKEIMQFQEKLHATVGRNRIKMAMGYYVLDNIKFPIKYIANDPKKIIFEPLEMPQKMNAIQILARHPAGRAYGYQLENFDKYPVYYDSDGQVLSLPPIINSNDLGHIDHTTKDILIECSGSDLNILKKCIIIAVCDLLNSNKNARAYSIDIIYSNKNKTESISLNREPVKLNLNNAKKLLGLELKEFQISQLLQKMDYIYKNKTAYAPVYRTDILHEVDLIEDIAIAYGYDKIIPQIPQISTIGQIDSKEIIKKKISDILTGLGLLEISNLHLTTRDAVKKANLNEEQQIKIPNSKTEFNILRPDLSNCVLRILSENVDVEYPQEIFEIGKVFGSDYKEYEHLLIALAPGNFTKAKQIINYLVEMLNHNIKIEKQQSNKNNNNYCIDGRIADVIINNKKAGFVGEVHPQILKNFKIKMPLTIIEFDLSEILK